MNNYDLNSSSIMNFKSVQAQQQTQQNQPPQQKSPVQQPLPAVQLPAMYQNAIVKDKATFKETLKKWDIMNLIYPWIEHPFLMLGTCCGLAFGVDKFSQACGGEYEKSLVGKAANFGDKIENSKFVKSKPFQTVLDWGKSIKNKFGKITKKSDLINAIKNTPSEPEWGMVKDELLNMKQRIAQEFTKVTGTLKLTQDGYAELSELGLDKTEKEFLKKFFNGKQISEETASNAIQLKRIGLADDAINEVLSKSDATIVTKAKQLEKLGVDAEFLQKLEKEPASLRDIVKIKDACKNAKGIRIGAGHYKWMGPVQPFERKIGFDEIFNRLESMTKAKTKTGRAMSTFLQKCHRGFTFGGGKLGVLFFVSPFIVDTILNIKKAEPKEKVGTGVQGFINSISWVFTFPIALDIMHHFGGMQYAGMSKENVAEYRKLISEFNQKVDNGLLKDKAAYDKALKELKKGVDGKGGLKALKATKGQTLFTKICKKIGSFMTMDLETIRPFKGSNPITNTIRKIPNFLKNVGGVPMRFMIWGALTMGVLDTAINKTIKACFGNYYDGMKEEEHTEAKKAQKEFLKKDLQKRLLDAQTQKVYGVALKDNAELNNKNENSDSMIKYNEQSKQVSDNIKQRVQELDHTRVQDKTSLKNESNITESYYQETNNNFQQDKTINTTEEEPSETDLKQENTSPVIMAEQEDLTNTEPLEKKQNVMKNEQAKVEKEKVQDNLPYSVSNNYPKETVTNIDNYSYIPNQNSTLPKIKEKGNYDNYTYIPSSENVLKKESKDSDTQKYIPSQEGAKFTKTFDNSGLADALRRADRAEEKALRILSGNFDEL